MSNSPYSGNGDGYNPPRGGYNQSDSGYGPPPGGYYPPPNQGYGGQPPPPAPQRPAQFPPPPEYPAKTLGYPPRQSQQQLRGGGGSSVMISPPLRQLLTNDYVLVHIESRGWVCGVVLAVLKATGMLTHWGYKVRYGLPGARMDREGEFPSDRVKPTE
ncbi:hypothetical protein FPV67DRAFT_894525 [Lyophyllum atratum]|nr:hypothetical protein FPV67DRAFT_894525 [Lyophyllum atratum]